VLETASSPLEGPPEGRILAGYCGFNANISFPFQATKNLSAHVTSPTMFQAVLYIFCGFLLPGISGEK